MGVLARTSKVISVLRRHSSSYLWLSFHNIFGLVSSSSSANRIFQPVYTLVSEVRVAKVSRLLCAQVEELVAELRTLVLTAASLAESSELRIFNIQFDSPQLINFQQNLNLYLSRRLFTVSNISSEKKNVGRSADKKLARKRVSQRSVTNRPSRIRPIFEAR